MYDKGMGCYLMMAAHLFCLLKFAELCDKLSVCDIKMIIVLLCIFYTKKGRKNGNLRESRRNSIGFSKK